MIENSIRTKALSSQGLVALIGENFHLTENHNSKDNYILLTVIDDDTPIEIHMEDNQSEALVQFDCYSKLPVNAKAIAKEIESTFNKKGFVDTDVKVQLALKNRRIPDFDTGSKLYRESYEYIFHYHNIINEV
ncbi:hypothetical protein P4S60_09225 [Pseudoalteromonas sp. Hal040]|jgi:hypothetical protein|uniref:hypothetical protein n=1 Tax=unclassified Pseudoalteromonas TaxID=194690 RepID=UPI001E632A9E|nr:hypothetical protein [Pseudoalteromonas sp. MB41]MCC9659241.1 hypothetical protein [Pseudoalteromonas sp. MB41]